MKKMRYACLFAMLLLFGAATEALAQKGKTNSFSADKLPDELLEYLNKSTSDSDRQKENTRMVKQFRATYGALDGEKQKRFTDVVDYAVKIKLKPNPELSKLVQVFVLYATAPGGDANTDGWLKAMELMRRKAKKTKAVNEFVDFSEQLLRSRVLYHSNSCQWNLPDGATFSIVVENDKVLVRVDQPTNLHYASVKDNGIIHNTTGVYDYVENVWSGRGGRVDWSRTGLGTDVCYANLASYQAVTRLPNSLPTVCSLSIRASLATPSRVG